MKRLNRKPNALISVVGDRDPFPLNRPETDGSLLHILRYYKPEVVQLILTKDRYEFLKETNWLEDILRLMKTNWSYSPTILEHKILETDSPHLIKSISKDIHSWIREFLNNYEDKYDCYINISSGTPAMKSIAEIETLSNNITGIQVSGFPIAWNKKEQTIDVDKYFEDSKEDDSDEMNRCEIADLTFIKNENNINIIERILKAYNYTTLIDLINSEFKILKPYQELIRLLKAKKDFYDQEIELRLKKVLRNKNLKIDFPLVSRAYGIDSVQAQTENDLIEYYLILQMLEKNKEYTDFIIHLNPFLVNLAQYLIQKFLNEITGTNTNYFDFDEQGRPFLSKKLLDRDLPGFLESYLKAKGGWAQKKLEINTKEKGSHKQEKEIQSGAYDDRNYFNLDLGAEIIRFIYDNYKDKYPKLFNQKHNIGTTFINLNNQNDLRNIFAHRLKFYNPNEIKRKIKKPYEILYQIGIILNDYLDYYDPEYAQTFDKANAYILEELKKYH